MGIRHRRRGIRQGALLRPAHRSHRPACRRWLRGSCSLIPGGRARRRSDRRFAQGRLRADVQAARTRWQNGRSPRRWSAGTRSASFRSSITAADPRWNISPWRAGRNHSSPARLPNLRILATEDAANKADAAMTASGSVRTGDAAALRRSCDNASRCYRGRSRRRRSSTFGAQECRACDRAEAEPEGGGPAPERAARQTENLAAQSRPSGRAHLSQRSEGAAQAPDFFDVVVEDAYTRWRTAGWRTRMAQQSLRRRGGRPRSGRKRRRARRRR